MVKLSTYKITTLFIALFVSLQLTNAEPAEAFARITVSPREGVVRQPYKVTISAYSSTWFSKPLDFANFRLDNAFIIPFTRTQSGISYINRKKYASLTFYFLVFPYEAGEMYIPEITLTTSVPPEGGYKGEPRTLKTKRQRIVVDEVPDAEGAKVELVAYSSVIKETWNKSLKTLKVGDVVERRIVINATGTLPSLIPPLKIEETQGISIYASDALLKDKRDDKTINGQRTEIYSYLFEEEGEVTIPAEEIIWWNPNTKRVYKRIIEERRITISENPDLALLQSLKDSLNAINAPSIANTEEEKYPWKRAVICGIIALLILIVTYKITKHEFRRAIKKRQAYLNSEKYFYKKLKQSIKKRQLSLILMRLYQWLDHTKESNQPYTISAYLDEEDFTFYNTINKKTTEIGYKLSQEEKKRFNSLISRLRNKVLHPLEKEIGDYLNP